MVVKKVLTSLLAVGDVVIVTKKYPFCNPGLTGLVGTISHVYTRTWNPDDLVEIDTGTKKILFLNSSLANVPLGEVK